MKYYSDCNDDDRSKIELLNIENKDNYVRVVDNFLTEQQLLHFDQYTKKCNWKLDQHSVSEKEFFKKFQTQQELFWYADIPNNMTDILIDNMCKKFDVDYESLILRRQYINGQTYGQTAYCHNDYGYSLIYYPHYHEWDNNFGGELIFYDCFNHYPYYEAKQAVTPHRNRAVLFCSQIYHRIVAPTRIFTDLRVSYALKIPYLEFI